MFKSTAIASFTRYVDFATVNDKTAKTMPKIHPATFEKPPILLAVYLTPIIKLALNNAIKINTKLAFELSSTWLIHVIASIVVKFFALSICANVEMLKNSISSPCLVTPSSMFTSSPLKYDSTIAGALFR